MCHISNYRIVYSSIELREESNRNIVIEITEIELPCNFLLMYRLCLTGNECGPDTMTKVFWEMEKHLIFPSRLAKKIYKYN